MDRDLLLLLLVFAIFLFDKKEKENKKQMEKRTLAKVASAQGKVT